MVENQYRRLQKQLCPQSGKVWGPQRKANEKQRHKLVKWKGKEWSRPLIGGRLDNGS